MKTKGIPLKEQQIVHIAPETYEKMIRERDDFIDNLFIALHALQKNQCAEIMPLLERTVQERNELDYQLALLKEQFQEVVKDNVICRNLTKHFTTKTPD